MLATLLGSAATVDGLASTNPGMSRRAVFHTTKTATLGAFTGWIIEPKARRAMAAIVTDPSEAPEVASAASIPSYVQGTVTIPSDFDFEEAQAKTQLVDPTGKTMTPIPALYITCRPDRPDNVPKAILDGSRGKAPPVLTARFERPTFPFSFHLTEADFTIEGKPASEGEDPFWLNDDLIVSARLDMDGIAATRSPEDLVGRTVYEQKKGGEAVQLDLTGRGAFGKFATKK